MMTISGRCLAGLAMLVFATGVAARSLKETGDIGRVTDTQGVAAARAMGGDRWSMAAPGFALKPGDWLRTDVRGANALRLRLTGGGEVILGPGTLIEVVDAGSLALLHGEIEVAALPGKDHRLTVLRRGFELRDGARKVLRCAQGGDVEELAAEPNWLQGFKGARVTESMGSLLATVDGRNTPLSIGYHKVTVDIRDQIARTVVEESFVNHTGGTLEGVFYFPLPQDASISGFGMWINGELVEADVVEKQRAREIYETILRERRDPGLLEWAGGNLFKARVFPITPHAEKRVRITYTQVLPLRKGVCRYRYALQSEMLRQNPLRELSIQVRVASALPVSAITCATHDARLSHTDHAAQAEFTAQEYSPQSDFELDVAVDAAAAPVVMLPHRRGEDGYFLALVTPPGGDGEWERETIPDGPPLHLVVLADTSGSMDAAARANRDALLGALLSSLGGHDSFEVATCDVETRWVPDGAGDRDARVLSARNFVAERVSLGWTDLDQAFAAVCGRVRATPGTQVIYIGDGVITTGDADPVAFASRLKLLGANSGATFHAVAPSSRYEPGVLKAIAAIGGGSLRRVGGSDTAAATAQSLLAGMARTGLRGMTVAFEGVRTARVYPQELPNLPDGEQQIVLGRYLPDGTAQAGRITVTGTRDGKPITYAAPVTLADAESGNAFIPRLWARMHLDALLEQGAAAAVRDEIIALSEEYRIMTPYTSFLVLESDADRQRFAVKQRFAMRDGERFFADGRDHARQELLAQQMRAAGSWRSNLRRAYLNDLNHLGREYFPESQSFRSGGMGGGAFKTYIGAPTVSGANSYADIQITREMDYSFGLESEQPDMPAASSFPSTPEMPTSFEQPGEPLGDEEGGAHDGRMAGGSNGFETRNVLTELESPDGDDLNEGLRNTESFERDGKPMYFPTEYEPPGVYDRRDRALQADPTKGLAFDSISRRMRHPQSEGWKSIGFTSSLGYSGDDWSIRTQDLLAMFPAAIGKPGPVMPDRPAAGTPHPWPAAALAAADGLLRWDKLAALRDGGVMLTRKVTCYDVRRDAVTAVAGHEAWLSGNAWAVKSFGERQNTQVEWWSERDKRGNMALALGLGRTRPGSAKDDRSGFPPFLTDYSLVSLADVFAYMKAFTGEEPDHGRMMLELVAPNDKHRVNRYIIDTSRHVLLEETRIQDGQLTFSEVYSDFVEAAGCWWARRIEQRNAHGKITMLVETQVLQRNDTEFRDGFAALLEPRGQVVFIDGDLPAVNAAKLSALAGKETLESAFALLNHFAGSQQWDRVNAQFEAMRGHAIGKPGIGMLEIRLLAMRRRNDEARKRIMDAATALAAAPCEHALFLADRLRSEANPVASAAEQHDLLQTLKPVYQRAPAHLLAPRDWGQAMVRNYQSLGRTPEALELAAKLAREFPWDPNTQTQYANLLANSGNIGTGLAWLDALTENKDRRWTSAEIGSFRMCGANLAESQNLTDDLLRISEAWMRDEECASNGTLPYRYWLAAMIRLGKTDEAYAKIDAWLADGAARKGKDFDLRTRNRLGAAIDVLTGRAQGVQANDIPERFHQGLAKVVRAFALSAKDASFAETIMNDYRFSRTERIRTLRKHFTGVLQKRAAKLEVAALNRLLDWVGTNNPAVAPEVWESLARDLTARSEKQGDAAMRDELAGPIERILSGHLGAGRYVEFLRHRMNQAPEQQRGTLAGHLFDALLNQGWSAQNETDAFELLYQIDFMPDDKDRLQIERRAGALMRLDDWVMKTRLAAEWENLAGKEDLTRVQLAAKRRDIMRTARLALLERLTGEPAKRQGEVAAAMAVWTNCESLYQMVRLNQDAGEIAAQCWKWIDRADPLKADGNSDRPWLRDVLVERHLATLESLAARPTADPADARGLLDWLARAIAAQPDEEAWKRHMYRLLVVLDRPAELKTVLLDWTRRDSGTGNLWRIALGYLYAETGDVAGAVSEFEAVEKDDELGPAEYRALSKWYLALNRMADQTRAAVAQYGAMREWDLSNRIQSYAAKIERGFNNGVPEDFDPAVVDMLRAVFRKAPNPGQNIYQLGTLYRYTKDFRLLECLADGVVGNSAGQIYAFLGSMNSVLQYVNDEAVCDQILANLETARKNVKTRVDARGLDFLECMVRRKAAEVLNQPGRQLPMALDAMRRAFAGDEWGIGERLLMAQFLAGLGTITQDPLAQEQRNELQALYQASEVGTADRMHIGAHWAGVVRGYGQAQRAVDLLGVAIREYRATRGGLLTPEAQALFDQWIGYHEADRHFAGGEKEIVAALDMKTLESVRQWLVERKFRLYMNALAEGGAVSIGQGRGLFDQARAALADELRTGQHSHRGRLCDILINMYRVANDRAKLTGVARDLVEFAGGPFDGRVSFQTTGYQNLVRQLGTAMREIAGDREALAFLITRCEVEPAFFRATGQGGWNGYGYQLAEYRSRVKDPGDLDARLLKIALNELRRDLETGNSSNRTLYHDNYSYFWKEKRADFLALAMAVIEEKHHSVVVVKFAADYLFDGLEAHDEALAALTAAHGRKLLDEGGISQLAAYHERLGKDAEALPYLAELVAVTPANADYRRRLIGSLGRSGRRDMALAATHEAMSYFKGKHAWNEAALAPLAQGCHEGKIWDRGVELYDELIPMHQRTRRNRGIGNGTLSGYYTRLAECHAALGDTARAVEAAAGAIVSWGARHEQRTQALAALRGVLEQARELHGFIAMLDKQVAECGLENPLVRKALGEVLLARKDFPKALANLRRALETRPDDAEIHTLLVAAYDGMGDADGALRQLLDAVGLSPGNLELFKDLGERFEKSGRAQDAERARTGMVEALPNESEGHTMLAGIRQAQNRWPEAIAEWRRVAAIRSLEPTGLLNLAMAQTHEKLWEAARASAKMLLAREWPSRFGDVHAQASEILRTASEAELRH